MATITLGHAGRKPIVLVPCSIPDCTKPIEARGYCPKHYRRWQRHGDPLGGRLANDTPLAERIWPFVDQSGGSDACWPWLGRRDRKGYGRATWKGREIRVPRLVFELIHGPIVKRAGYHGTVIRHACDNPSCCNPAHLLAGTAADNNRDRQERGRTVLPTYAQRMQNVARGERVAGARLTEAAVRTIRERFAAGASKRELALAFGVSRRTIQFAVEGKSWAHVGGPA
jgi:hypothetical protein